MRATVLLSAGGFALLKRAVIIGTTVNDNVNEVSNATVIEAATWPRNTLTSSFAATIFGINTMMDVIDPATTARPTSRTPAIDASTGDFPSNRYLCILSVTTTALSTSIPTANIKPIIDIMFSVKPPMYRKPIVINKETGTANATTSVFVIFRRKKNSITNDSSAPITPDFSNSCKELMIPAA